jgi:tetratricopeptide (TPR) repeat protein
MRKSTGLAVIICLALSGQMLAVGEARLTGKVIDQDGKPLEGVAITITSATAAKTYKDVVKTNRKGDYAIFVIDGTIPYSFEYTKEGYSSYKDEMKLKLVPEKNVRDITLVKGGASAGTAMQTVEASADPAVVAYNEGVVLVKEGKDAEAIAKFESAVNIRPELTAGYIALAKVNAKISNWDKAIENGLKALEVDDDQPEIHAIMAEAYGKKGDKAKAAEYRKKAPANPRGLFNEAARLINDGKDSEAEPLLKQAVGADPSFGLAFYELGMVQARLGKNADARESLQKYIDLEPNGKDTATAKEMMKYLQ